MVQRIRPLHLGTRGRIRSLTGTKRVTFLPSDIPDLKLWFEADYGVTMDGSNQISTWLNRASGGDNANQGSATNAPKLVPGALNGLPAVHFCDIVSGSLEIRLFDTGFFDDSANGVFTLIHILSLDPPYNGYPFGTYSSSTFTGAQWLYSPFPATDQAMDFIPQNNDGTSSSYAAGTIPNDGSYNLFLMTSDAPINGGTITFELNKTLINTTAYGAFQYYPSGQFRLGTDQVDDFNGEFFGSMALTLWYGRVLTPTEIQKIYTYIHGKYGL